MLDCVRCGNPTDVTVSILQIRVIQGSVSDKFIEIQQSKQSPVAFSHKGRHVIILTMKCLVASLQKFINCCVLMKLMKLVVHVSGKKLLNKDCNLTAVVETKLVLAVEARVMLRRNIDTNAGLVNCAIGTVLSIRSDHVSVQFDHISEPYDV